MKLKMVQADARPKLTCRVWSALLSEVVVVLGDPTITYFPARSGALITSESATKHHTRNEVELLIGAAFPDADIRSLVIGNEIYLHQIHTPAVPSRRKYTHATSQVRIVLFPDGDIIISTGGGGLTPEGVVALTQEFQACLSEDPLKPKYPFLVE